MVSRGGGRRVVGQLTVAYVPSPSCSGQVSFALYPNLMYAYLFELLKGTRMSSVHIACTYCTACCVPGNCPASRLRARGLLRGQALRSGAMFEQDCAWADDSLNDFVIRRPLCMSW